MAQRALGPATLALVQAIEGSVRAGDRQLLVACSGGPDSLALAQATVHVGRRRKLPVAAAVVDHGLQPSSTDQATAAASTLTELGFNDVTVRAVAVRPSGDGPEAAARTARYRALEEVAAPRHATVLLGHTRHDQAETVLLALARGSGTRSLAGMAVRNGRWLRPLLDLGRETTELACRENDLVPWLDPHNFDAAYARVRVRTSVLPTLERELGPGIAAALARTARLARDDADALDALAADADPGTATLDCRSMTALVPALRRRVLTRWLRLEHGLDGLTSAHLFAVEELLTAWHGQAGVDVPGGVRVRRVEGRLEATPVDNAVSPLVRGNVRPGQR